MKVSIIVPAYNEVDAIRSVIDGIKLLGMEDREIIVVDDGSLDGTYDAAKGIGGITVLKHEKNLGKGVALKTGIGHSKGDVIITIDADGTYPADDIPRLIEKMEEGYDMAIGSRFLGKTNSMPKIRFLGNIFFSKMVSLTGGKEVSDASSGLRAFKKNIINDMKIGSRNLSWEVEVTTKFLRKGFRIAEVPIEYSERIGKSKLRIWKDGFSFLFAILRSVV